MFKVLILPLNYSTVSYNYMAEIFRSCIPNCHAEIFDYMWYSETEKNTRKIRKDLINKVREFQPDLMLIQIQHTTIICGETIKQCKQVSLHTKIVNWTLDCRSQVIPQYRDVGQYSDYNLICSTGQLQLYRDSGLPNVRFWQVGYSEQYHYPLSESKDSYDFDVVFIANVNTQECYPSHTDRIATVKLLYNTFGFEKFGLFGSGWEQFNIKSHGGLAINDASINGYHRGHCNLSISHFQDVPHYFSDRLLHCLASGRPTISWHFPGIESYFQDKVDLLVTRSPEDIVNKVKYLLDNPELANYIGLNGGAKAYSEHTYISRIIELLDMIGLK